MFALLPLTLLALFSPTLSAPSPAPVPAPAPVAAPGHHATECAFACAERDLQGHALKKSRGKPDLGTLTCEYHDGHIDWPWDRPVCAYDFHGHLTQDKDDHKCPQALVGCSHK